MAENKTKPTSVPVSDFLATVSEQRQAEARTLIQLMQTVSGEKPVMWGPSIIGFGTQQYKSEAGRTGDMGILGFSPRNASLTIYFYEGFDRYGAELAKLGKHKVSQSCLYVNKLTDIDVSVLKTMLESSFTIATNNQPKTVSVADYIAAIPAAARPKFDELRALVKAELPHANEVMSYGIVGYKPDPKKRAVVFISGWKDHLGVYPIPHNDALRAQLAPYIKGKGTLWFSITEPLPKPIIIASIKALAGT